MKPTQEKFLEYLAHYEFKASDTNEQISYKVLDCAYDLFCALDALAKNHKAMKAQILNILEPNGVNSYQQSGF